jgi:hypothetical protein
MSFGHPTTELGRIFWTTTRLSCHREIVKAISNSWDRRLTGYGRIAPVTQASPMSGTWHVPDGRNSFPNYRGRPTRDIRHAKKRTLVEN